MLLLLIFKLVNTPALLFNSRQQPPTPATSAPTVPRPPTPQHPHQSVHRRRCMHEAKMSGHGTGHKPDRTKTPVSRSTEIENAYTIDESSGNAQKFRLCTYNRRTGRALPSPSHPLPQSDSPSRPAQSSCVPARQPATRNRPECHESSRSDAADLVFGHTNLL